MPYDHYLNLKKLKIRQLIEYLIACERHARSIFADVCKNFTQKKRLTFTEKKSLWRVYWYTYTLRELIVTRFCVPLNTLKQELLEQSEKLNLEYKTVKIPDLGYCELQQGDKFEIEDYLGQMVNEKHLSEKSDLPRPELTVEIKLQTLMNPLREAGIIYFNNHYE